MAITDSTSLKEDRLIYLLASQVRKVLDERAVQYKESRSWESASRYFSTGFGTIRVSNHHLPEYTYPIAVDCINNTAGTMSAYSLRKAIYELIDTAPFKIRRSKTKIMRSKEWPESDDEAIECNNDRVTFKQICEHYPDLSESQVSCLMTSVCRTYPFLEKFSWHLFDRQIAELRQGFDLENAYLKKDGSYEKLLKGITQ